MVSEHRRSCFGTAPILVCRGSCKNSAGQAWASSRRRSRRTSCRTYLPTVFQSNSRTVSQCLPRAKQGRSRLLGPIWNHKSPRDHEPPPSCSVRSPQTRPAFQWPYFWADHTKLDTPRPDIRTHYPSRHPSRLCVECDQSGRNVWVGQRRACIQRDGRADQK
jgi:hypothetical protein